MKIWYYKHMDWLIKKLKMPQLNQVILIIILAEFVFSTAGSLVNPVFALFVVDVVGAPITVIGFSVAIYWIIKSILQLPIARMLDKNHGEIDDYYSILAGITLSIVVVYLYYFVSAAWQIYALQFTAGVGDALIVPALLAIFTRHLDKDQEAFELALRSSFSYGASSALGGALSGILVVAIGIRPLYLINGTIMLLGLIILLFLRPYVKPRVPRDLAVFYDDKKKI